MRLRHCRSQMKYIKCVFICISVWILSTIFNRGSVSEWKRHFSKAEVIYHYNDTRYGRFDVTKVKLKFLKNFKNFCFLEQIQAIKPNTTVYQTNKYLEVKRYDKREWYTARLEKVMWNTPQGVLIEDEMCGEYKKCRVRCLPYYIMLGQAKSGTTDFAQRIKDHPMIFDTIMKEPFYWSHIRFLINATVGDYADFFDFGLSRYINNPSIAADDTKYYPQIGGELTSFTFTDDAWWMEQPGNEGLLEPRYLKVHDMYSVMPDVKLLLMLRNPVNRLYSSYNMYREWSGSSSPMDFHIRVLKSMEWWYNCTVIKGLPKRRCVYGSPPEMPPLVADLGNRWIGKLNVANYSAALMKSMYVIILKDWLSVYPREQLLIIKTEEYAKDPLTYFNEVVFPYLGVPPVNEAVKIAKEEVTNSRAYQPMLPETREILTKFYSPFNKELAEYLGDDRWLWND